MNVVHYLSSFPARTETFVRPLLVGADRYRPTVWTRARGEGEEVEGLRVEVLPEEEGAARWAARLRARVGGFELREEAAVDGALSRFGAPEVIHAHFGPQGYACARAARRHGVPLVCTFYGYDLGIGAAQPWRGRYETLFGVASALLVEGPAMREALLALGAPPDRVQVQPLPVVASRYTLRPPIARAAAGGPYRALLIGRMVAKKGVDLAIRAIAAMPDLILDVIGDGDLLGEYVALAGALGVADRVRFLGARPHRETIEAMGRADLLLQPSRTAPDGDTEGGAPYTLLEAQLRGLPLVVSDHADLPWVVQPGAGRVFPEGEVDGLVAAIEAQLDDAAHYDAAAVRARVLARHDARICVAELESRYDRARGGEGAA